MKKFKFDDGRVTRVELNVVLEEQYGGELELSQRNSGSNRTNSKVTKSSNAYMLVYIRKSDKEKIICNIDDNDIGQHLRVQLNNERDMKEQKEKEKADFHLYTTIKVIRDCDLAQQIGKHIYFDLINLNKVYIFNARNDTPLRLFKEQVAKKFVVSVPFIRFWLWVKRTNFTFRPYRILGPNEESLSVGEIRVQLYKEQFAEMIFFAEFEVGQDSIPISLPEKNEDDFLLFFKYYNPEKNELRYVGNLIVKNIGKPIEIVKKLNAMAGLLENDKIDLYEEITFMPDVMCTPLENDNTFKSQQLQDGDIICYQKSSSDKKVIRYPDVPSFFEYIQNRQGVFFISPEKPKYEDFYLELSNKMTYDEIVESIASEISRSGKFIVDPSKIRLTQHNFNLGVPMDEPIKYQSFDNLLAMLYINGQITNTFYYEVLDIPLPILQNLRCLEIIYHETIQNEPIVHYIRLPKESTVFDIIDNLKTKIHQSHPNMEFRLVEIIQNKIYRILSPNEKIEYLMRVDNIIRLEEIPEDEKCMGINDRLVHVYHFRKKENKMTIVNFGDPFLLSVSSNEKLSEIKIRIQKRLQISDEEFSKWKFASCIRGLVFYLEDDEIILHHIQEKDPNSIWESYLGLEHSNTLLNMEIRKKTQKVNYQKPVKIN
ncbi:hypothetical protein ZOSMA_141G00080 [Zostera marina]|uniref:ubiquitinyl hydrolase 1 n=1 Tax=Zostera marina TaxID=29655 RepID=A0A0K9PXG2_ZOSMR|nr:hypothetical protein ZOSMA_141G00080 [Zostera marina]